MGFFIVKVTYMNDTQYHHKAFVKQNPGLWMHHLLLFIPKQKTGKYLSLPSLQLKKFPGALWALGAGCQTKEKHWEQLARLGIEILPRSFVLPWDPSQWAGRCSLVGPRCWQSGTLPAAQRAASAGTPVCRRALPGLLRPGTARCRHTGLGAVP